METVDGETLMRDYNALLAERDRYRDRVHQLEVEVGLLRDAIENYALWEPGRAGHAAAHRKLMEALNG